MTQLKDLTPRENLLRAFKNEKPFRIPDVGFVGADILNFRPRLIPDNYATHLIADGEPEASYESNTTRGWFGLDWVYVPKVGGATVKPGKPMIEDMNDWEKLVVWPDLDALDWKGMAEKNKDFLNTDRAVELCLLDGFWERLISFMDVSGAAVALIDEDQQDAVKAFFDKYADFMISYIRHVKEVCPIDIVLIHDDWGTQNGPFFSPDTAREMLLPYLKRVVSFIHSEGMYYEQHSCGFCTKFIDLYIEAGVDLWCPQLMNDFELLTGKAKGTQLHIEMMDVLPQGLTEEADIRQAARDFYDHYGIRGVWISPFFDAPAFKDELAKYSFRKSAE